jgi:hypothetical protein
MLEAADNCHITKSIEEGLQIVCTLADTEADSTLKMI